MTNTPAEEVDVDSVDGSTLRKLYESEREARKTAESELRVFKVQEILQSTGAKFVKAEDIGEDVPIDQISVMAETLQSERVKERRDILESAGVPAEQIEKALAGDVADAAPNADQHKRMAAVRSADLKPPPPLVEGESLSPREKISKHFASR